jgi:pyruvyltransferase
VIAVGSVAALATRGAVLWGTGIMNRDDRIQPGVQIAAVRGPLTREAAQRSKVPCPPVFGDPGLLVPRLLPRQRASCDEPGLVPHFSNLADARLPAGWRLVDVRESVDVFVDQLCRCAWVASSSLHGIILAHAYGIPAAWVSYGILPSGDDTKFHDYFLSVGVPVPAPVPIYPAFKDGVAVNSALVRVACTLPARLPDLEALLAACPFRTCK